jgi:hypothetical protein
MLNQRIEAIQQEMEKGEKADFSQFKAYSSGDKTVIQHSQMETQDQAAKEEGQDHHHVRSR